MLKKITRAGRKFWDFIKPRKKLGLVSFIILFAGGTFLFLFGASRVSATESIIWTPLIKLFTDLVIWIAGFFIQATVFIMDFVIEIAGYNDFINSKPVMFGWTLVRDVSNMFFVVILLIIAFGTVLGVETYSWKKLLVKFVLAAILVNFSRIICGVIIDAAQVFMMTFLNGVAAVAGGNIVNAFKLNEVLSFSDSLDPERLGDVAVLGSAIAAGFFSAIAAFTIGAYLIVLLARVVSLWILIILSPLAFVLSVIPKTQSYSGQWWSEFSNNVIAGPIMVFFLWLSFAVVGDGLVHEEFATSPFPMETDVQKVETAGATGQKVMGGLAEVMEWGNLANFIIAVGLLLAGVKATQKLGVVGAGLMGRAVETAKRVATVTTGVAAGRWVARKGVEGAKVVGKGALMKAPLVGGEAWRRRGRRIAGRVSAKMQDFQYGREQIAKKLGKFGEKEKGAKGFFKRLGGKALAATPLFTTEMRAEEASKQWGKLAEARKETRKEDLGLGTREVGRETLREKARLDTIKAQSEMAKQRHYNRALVDYYEAPDELKDLQAQRGGLATRESAQQTLLQEASLEIVSAREELEKVKDDPERTAALEAKINESTAKREEVERNLASVQSSKGAIDQKINEVYSDDSRWNKKNLIGRDVLKDKFELEKNQADLAAAKGMMELSYLNTETGKKVQASQAEAKIIQQQLNETVNAKKQLSELQKIEQLLKKPQPGQDTSALSMRYQALQQELNTSRAGGEQLRIDQTREAEKKLADARDAKLKEVGGRPTYLNQVLQKHAKEDIELYSSNNWDQMMTNVDFLTSQIGKATGDTKAIMQKDLQNWLLAAFNRGPDFGIAALNRSKKNEDVKISDVNSVRAADLSAFLGEKVEQTESGVNQALAKLKELQGDHYDAFMANYVGGLATMADNGAVGHGGLYKMVVDKNTGRQTYKTTNREYDKDLINSKRDFHVGQARAAGHGFAGAMDFKGGKFTLDSEDAVKHVVELMGGRTTQGYGRMHKINFDSLNMAIENTENETYVEKLMDGLKQSVPDKKALQSLLARLNDKALEKIKKYVKEIPMAEKK